MKILHLKNHIAEHLEFAPKEVKLNFLAAIKKLGRAAKLRLTGEGQV